MRITVTGYKGFIGSYLFENLRQLGHEVSGLDKDNCDITNLKKLANFMADMQPEVVFHLAAHLPVNTEEDSEQFFRANVYGTFNLLESMKACKICRIIYSSTMNVYGKVQYLPVDESHPTAPINIYGFTKLLGERLCEFYTQNFKYKITILRYSGVYGPGRDKGAIDTFISKALKNETLQICSDGSDTWDTLYVDDIVRANLLALENMDNASCDVFNIGCGQGLVVKEVAQDIIEYLGSNSKISFMKNKGDINFYYHIAKAKEKLKFVPRSFRESLHNFIDYKKSMLESIR